MRFRVRSSLLSMGNALPVLAGDGFAGESRWNRNAVDRQRPSQPSVFFPQTPMLLVRRLERQRSEAFLLMLSRRLSGYPRSVYKIPYSHKNCSDIRWKPALFS